MQPYSPVVSILRPVALTEEMQRGSCHSAQNIVVLETEARVGLA